MNTYLVTARVEIEVEAYDEAEAVKKARFEVDLDVLSFNALSVECLCENEDE